MSGNDRMNDGKSGEDAAGWTIFAVEMGVDGKLVAVTVQRERPTQHPQLVGTTETVRLVNEDTVLSQMASMDPMGQLVGSALFEMLFTHKKRPAQSEREMRRVVAGARIVGDEVVRRVKGGRRKPQSQSNAEHEHDKDEKE